MNGKVRFPLILPLFNSVYSLSFPFLPLVPVLQETHHHPGEE